jgi:biopolymer transport protein ExbD
VPTISDAGDSDVARDPNKVTLTLQVKATGAVSCTVANNELAPDQLAPYAKELPALPGNKLDARALNDHLWSIKEKFRASKDVIIVPEGDVTYEQLVELMDASRERKMIVNGKAVFPQMFPAVVVSSLVK